MKTVYHVDTPSYLREIKSVGDEGEEVRVFSLEKIRKMKHIMLSMRYHEIIWYHLNPYIELKVATTSRPFISDVVRVMCR